RILHLRWNHGCLVLTCELQALRVDADRRVGQLDDRERVDLDALPGDIHLTGHADTGRRPARRTISRTVPLRFVGFFAPFPGLLRTHAAVRSLADVLLRGRFDTQVVDLGQRRDVRDGALA